MNIDNKITIILIKKLVSPRSPEGNISILDIKAAKVEYAKQLNHLYIFDFSFIFSEVNTTHAVNSINGHVVTVLSMNTIR